MDVLSFDNTELDQFAKRSHQEVGLMFIDIDHLQQVNDPYGHEVGDKVIQQVGYGRLQLVRAADIPYRIVGDEFQLVVMDTNATGLTKLV